MVVAGQCEEGTHEAVPKEFLEPVQDLLARGFYQYFQAPKSAQNGPEVHSDWTANSEFPMHEAVWRDRSRAVWRDRSSWDPTCSQRPIV